MKPYFNRIHLLFVFAFFFSTTVFAQNGCPTCDDPANCSKFVFEFVPAKVRLAPGEKLAVEIQKWRTSKWLNEATRTQPSRCPEDRNISAPLDKIHIPTDNWYVIIQDGKTKSDEQYVLPQSTQTIPGYIRTLPISKVTVRTSGDTELGNAEIDLGDLPEGEYWFTLQNKATINDGEHCELECNKTTPPVKIEVKKTVNNPPSVNVVSYGGECEPVSIKISAHDQDNEPGGSYPRQTISVSGEIRNKTMQTSTHLVFTPGTTTGARYSETINLGNDLTPGEYEVEVRVSDGELSSSDKVSFLIKSREDCEPNVSIPAAALYFQFDEPRKSETANAAVESSDPRLWNAKERRSKCTNPYPSREYPAFTGEDLALGSNTERLRKIGQFLEANRNFYLTIKAFTDSKACDSYNCNLGMRRAQAVKDHLDRHYKLQDENGNSRVTIKTINRGEADALKNYSRSLEGINCSDEQKWDRRVELYYTREKDDADIGPCNAQKCATPERPRPSKRKAYGRRRPARKSY